MAQEPKDAEGRPYHIRLRRKDVAEVALLPGDPGRVLLIAKKLSKSTLLSSNREYTAYAGYAGREKVLAMSTGIGGPSTAIAVEELARLGVKTMIRVGTCGAISPKLKVGSVVIADAAVRMEGTSWQYITPGYPAAATPGVVLALEEAASRLGVSASVGISASTDSFYLGQGRMSFGGYFPKGRAHIVEDLRAAKVLCFEMEAATLFTLGRLFGLRVGAVLAVVGNRVTDEFTSEAGVDDAIRVAVEATKSLRRYPV
jgi:uridine phosphorylase